MNEELLKQFHQQENLRVEVYKFFKSVLDEITLERAYRGESTDGIKFAKDSLIKAETKLNNMFAEPQKAKDTRRAE